MPLSIFHGITALFDIPDTVFTTTLIKWVIGSFTCIILIVVFSIANTCNNLAVDHGTVESTATTGATVTVTCTEHGYAINDNGNRVTSKDAAVVCNADGSLHTSTTLPTCSRKYTCTWLGSFISMISVAYVTAITVGD